EYFGEPARQGVESDIACGHVDAAYMGNQRIELRASLGRKDSRNPLAVGRICGKAINGFGRNGDKTAALQHFHCAPDCLIIEFDYIGHWFSASRASQVKPVLPTQAPAPVQASLASIRSQSWRNDH